MPERVVDLHADVSELLERLAEATAPGDVTDAFLAACGILQLIEDWRDGTEWRARQLSAMLGYRGPSRRTWRAGVDLSAALRSRRRVSDVTVLIEELVDVLASDVMRRTEPAGKHRPRFPARAHRLVTELTAVDAHQLPKSLSAQVLRPPSCFRSFDQHPRDVAELAERFARFYPDRDKPLLVLGVRTSGGYLAPLATAALRALGYLDAESGAVRPGAPMPSAAIREVRAGGGVVLVIDDPPSSGASMAAVVRAVRRQGFAAEQVVPVFAAFGQGIAPAALAEYPCVILPAADWHIRTRLSGARLYETVRAAFPDREVTSVAAAEPGLPTREAHLAVRLTAILDDEQGVAEVELTAEGVGQGYLGRHAQEVAERLKGLVPPVYLVRDGVMLRAHGPERPVTQVPAETVAAYAAARQRNLATDADRSGALQGRQPVWEVGARVLASGFGRLGPLLRPALIDSAMREFLASRSPCLVDGTTAKSAWVRLDEAAHGFAKTDYDDGCFSHLDLGVYDALYDMAGASLSAPGTDRALIEAFELATGDRVDAARWAVFQLVQAWNLERARPGGAAAARAVQALFGRVFLGDLEAEPDGPWCVLDVDGVLELDFGGFPSTTLAAMSALRALRAHGYRVVLATGRSLPDVRDRCAAYRLAGGVGEYGAAAYDARTGATSALFDDEQGLYRRKALLEDLDALASTRIDNAYQWCVRASHTRSETSRGAGLSPAVANRLAEAHPGFAPVPGDAQTDFVPVGVEKAAGVRSLLQLLGDDTATSGDTSGSTAVGQVELAVGDSVADLGILRMARIGLAPAHASWALSGSGVSFTRSPYQAGLAQAVGRLIGHRPGSCRDCRLPKLTRGEALVLGLLSVGQGGRRALPAAALRLAVLRASGLFAGKDGKDGKDGTRWG